MPRVASDFDDDDDDDGEIDSCPECGAEVYSIADCCPQCGYWFVDDDKASMRLDRRTHGEMRIVKIGASILLAAMVLGLIMALLGGQ